MDNRNHGLDSSALEAGGAPPKRQGEGARASYADAVPGELSGDAELDVGVVSSRAEKLRARLIARYQLDSEYIGVTQLGLILGMSPSSIYAHIRAGTFFLPYRLFNATPKIFIDDLVEWHCSGVGVAQAFAPKPEKRQAPILNGVGQEVRALSRQEINEAVDQAAAHALRSMGIDPSSRRPRKSSRPR
jgi:hypothetical protein